MANPDFVDEGVTDQGGTASVTASFPTTWAANQIALWIIATDGAVPTLSTANGFVLAQDPLGNTASVTTNSGTAGTNDCGVFVFWKRLVGSTTTTDPAPILAAPSSWGGTVFASELNTYSGCRTSGTPFHIIATNTLLTASTAVTSPSVTPTLNGCTLVAVAAGTNDDTAFNSWSFSGAASPSGQIDSGWHNASANACSFTGGRGGYATAAGARTGTTTFGASTRQARVTLVLASLAEAAGPLTATAAVLGSSGATSSAVTVPNTVTAAVIGNSGSIVSIAAPGAQANAAIVGGAGATAITATIPLTLAAATVGNPGTITSSATAPGSGTLAIGRFGVKQKANTTSPNSGTITTFGVYPAWTASAAYTLANAIRVTNAGNIYELQQTGTSASSGGPSTTAAAITDGSAKWNYLGPGTGACDTQASGSFFIASLAWGREATSGTAPTDNKGNSWTQLDKHFYASFPSSAQAIYAATNPATGGAGHTISAAFGLGNDGGGDEITAIVGEIKGGTLIKSRSYVERASSTGNVVTSGSVTTTGPAILVAFWWLNGTVRAEGTNHDAVPGSGFAAIPEATALMEIGPSGAGEVQVATHFRQVATAGTYTASITTTSGEGSAVYLIAIQATDPPPGATATAAVLGERGAVAATALATVRATSAAIGRSGATSSSTLVSTQIAAAVAGGPGSTSSSVTVAGGAAPATASAAILGAAGSTTSAVASAVQAAASAVGAAGATSSVAAVGQQASVVLVGASGSTSISVSNPIAVTAAVSGSTGFLSASASTVGGPRVDASPRGGPGSVSAIAAVGIAAAVSGDGDAGLLAAEVTVQVQEEETEFARLVSEMDDVIISLLE